jgi:hypothetical protein
MPQRRSGGNRFPRDAWAHGTSEELHPSQYNQDTLIFQVKIVMVIVVMETTRELWSPGTSDAGRNCKQWKYTRIFYVYQYSRSYHARKVKKTSSNN